MRLADPPSRLPDPDYRAVRDLVAHCLTLDGAHLYVLGLVLARALPEEHQAGGRFGSVADAQVEEYALGDLSRWVRRFMELERGARRVRARGMDRIQEQTDVDLLEGIRREGRRRERSRSLLTALVGLCVVLLIAVLAVQLSQDRAVVASATPDRVQALERRLDTLAGDMEFRLTELTKGLAEIREMETRSE